MPPPYQAPNPFPDPLPPVPPRLRQPPGRVRQVREHRDAFDRAMQPVPGLPAVPTGPGVPTTDPRFIEALQNLLHGLRQGKELIGAGTYPGMHGLSPDVRNAARRAGIPTADIRDVYGGHARDTIGNALGDFGSEFVRGGIDTPLGQGIYEDAAVASGRIPQPPGLTATFETEELPNPYPGMTPAPLPPYYPQYPPNNAPGGYNPNMPIGPGNMSPGAPGMPGYDPSYPPSGLEPPPPPPAFPGYPIGNIPLPPLGSNTPPINIPPRTPPRPPFILPEPPGGYGPGPPYFPHGGIFAPPDLADWPGIDPGIGPAFNPPLTGGHTSGPLQGRSW